MDDSFAAEPVSAEHADWAVAALLGALELRHPGTCRHAERVAEIALDLTAALAEIERCSRGHPVRSSKPQLGGAARAGRRPRRE